MVTALSATLITMEYYYCYLGYNTPNYELTVGVDSARIRWALLSTAAKQPWLSDSKPASPRSSSRRDCYPRAPPTAPYSGLRSGSGLASPPPFVLLFPALPMAASFPCTALLDLSHYDKWRICLEQSCSAGGGGQPNHECAPMIPHLRLLFFSKRVSDIMIINRIRAQAFLEDKSFQTWARVRVSCARFGVFLTTGNDGSCVNVFARHRLG